MINTIEPKPLTSYQPEYYQKKAISQYISKWKIYSIVIGISIFFAGIIIVLLMEYPFASEDIRIIMIVKITVIGKIIQAIGALIICITLVFSALNDRLVESNIRASMVIVVGLIIALEIMFI